MPKDTLFVVCIFFIVMIVLGVLLLPGKNACEPPALIELSVLGPGGMFETKVLRWKFEDGCLIWTEPGDKTKGVCEVVAWAAVP